MQRRFAEMTALLGPPPEAFLRRSPQTLQFWDEHGKFSRYIVIALINDSHGTTGNWKSAVPLPDQTLEPLEIKLAGDDKTQFLIFMRKLLAWVPEERQKSEELLADEWVRGDDY